MEGAKLGTANRGAPAVERLTGSLGDALDEARASGADWIWVVEDSVSPHPDALQALLDALGRTDDLPAPAVLAGVVRTPDGALDRGRLAWYRRSDLDLALAAAAAQLLPIRATAGPVLVSRAALETNPPKDTLRPSPASILTWTAHLLRSGMGYLVPDSRYDAREAARDPLGDPRTAATLLIGGAVAGGDRLRVIHELVERVGVKLAENRRR